MDYKDEKAVIEVSVGQLVSMHGRYVTWELLAELGIKPPQGNRASNAAYGPCGRCGKVLGNYAKGFCHPCYLQEKRKLVDMQGRELHPRYKTPPCSTCGKADARTYQIAQTEEWFCLDHDTTVKRQAYSKNDVEEV